MPYPLGHRTFSDRNIITQASSLHILTVSVATKYSFVNSSQDQTFLQITERLGHKPVVSWFVVGNVRYVLQCLVWYSWQRGSPSLASCHCMQDRSWHQLGSIHFLRHIFLHTLRSWVGGMKDQILLERSFIILYVEDFKSLRLPIISHLIHKAALNHFSSDVWPWDQHSHRLILFSCGFNPKINPKRRQDKSVMLLFAPIVFGIRPKESHARMFNVTNRLECTKQTSSQSS